MKARLLCELESTVTAASSRASATPPRGQRVSSGEMRALSFSFSFLCATVDPGRRRAPRTHAVPAPTTTQHVVAGPDGAPLELVCQAALHSAAAALATCFFFVPGVSARRLWARSEEFYRPLPRVLLQPVPGVRVGAKINLETARLLGNICVTYRLLCYAVHLEVYA